MTNGKKTPASGASTAPACKGDVHVGNFMIEAKCTDKRTYSVSLGVLNKLTDEAMQINKKPALSIRFNCNSGIWSESDWVAIPLSIFRELIDGK